MDLSTGAVHMILDSEDTLFKVVVNDEMQYSIWPDTLPLPMGWEPTGKSGSKKECLQYVEQVWVDMRPLSLRNAIAATSAAD